MRKNLTLITVMGKTCSGKTTFAKTFYPNAKVIDVGDVVRSMVRQQVRIHQKRLVDTLIKELTYKVVSSEEDTVVVTGIRQKEIYEALLGMNHVKFESYWLEVPETVLCQRWTVRADPKDIGLTFKSVIQKDAELGLAELEEYVKGLRDTFIYKNINIKTSNGTNDTVQKRQKVKAPKVVSRSGRQ